MLRHKYAKFGLRCGLVRHRCESCKLLVLLHSDQRPLTTVKTASTSQIKIFIPPVSLRSLSSSTPPALPHTGRFL
jgi:hypothetical protein